MAVKTRPPHDRGAVLWDPSSGPSRMLTSSIDRWTSSLLADDGVDMPFMGGSESITATIVAKSDGILAGCAAVDHMLQIWAGGLQISWSHGEGRSITSGDEIAVLKGDKSIGYITSGGFAHFVNKSVAFSYVDQNELKSEKGIQVEINGDFFNCSIIKEPLYDPTGQKMRS